MYDDDTGGVFESRNFYQVATFPTHNIITPIVLIYGTIDSLVDIHVMLASLPKTTVDIPITGHEHLDLIWGDDVDTEVFPHIVDALRTVGKVDERSSSPQSDTTV
jgi:lysosomal acid lipase/cholesteryl ester hydrolase